MSRANNILAATGIVVAAVLVTYMDRPDLFRAPHGFGPWASHAAADWMQDTCKGNDGPYVKIMADVKHMAVTHTLTSKDLETYYRSSQADTTNPERAFRWAYACYLARRSAPEVAIPEPNSELALNTADDPNTYSYNRLHYLLTPPTTSNYSALAAIGNNILKTRTSDYQVEEHLIAVLMASKVDEWQLEALTHAHNLIRQQPRESEAYKCAADTISSRLDASPPYDVADAIEARNLYQKWLQMPGTNAAERSDVTASIQALEKYVARAGNDLSLIKVRAMSFDPDSLEVGLGVGPSASYADKEISPLPPPVTVVTTAGDKSVLLSWSSVPGARGYSVNQIGGHAGTQCTIVTAPGACTYLDYNLKNGTHYTYSISTLYGSRSISKPSAVVSGTPIGQPGRWRIEQATATASRPAIWHAQWIPDASGSWPTLLCVAVGEHRAVSSITKTPPIVASSYAGAYPPQDFSAYWTAPEDGEMHYCGSGQYESDDATYVTTSSPPPFSTWLNGLVVRITGHPLSSPPPGITTWNRTVHSDTSNLFIYSQPYLKRHFKSPADVSFSIPVTPVILDGVSGPPDNDDMTAQ